MSWFDEQIRQRKTEDDLMVNETLREAAGAVMGREAADSGDVKKMTGSAMERILRFYRLQYVEPPEDLSTLEERLDYSLHPEGVMYREVKLKGNWRKDATGAFLGFLKEDGTPVALIPSGLSGYRCYDSAGNRSWKVTKRTAGRLAESAYCFYRPFPQTKISIRSLSLYILSGLRPVDFLLILGVTLLATAVGMLVPRLTNLLFGTVLEKRNVGVLIAMAVFMLSVQLSMIVIRAGSDLISDTLQTRLDLGINAAAMMRVLSMPPAFFREYSSGDLATRVDSVNQLCSTLSNAVLNTGLTSLVSLLYVTQIFQYTPSLVTPALVIILLTVVLSTVTMILENRRQKEIMEKDAVTVGRAYALVNGIQKIRLAGAEKRSFAQWAKVYNESARLMYDPPFLLKIGPVLSEAVSIVGAVVIYAAAIASGVSMSRYVAFNAAYGMVMGAFTSLASTTMIFARIGPVLNMAAPILQTEPESGRRGKVVTELGGSIEMNDVTFRYAEGGPKVIDDLSLRIRPGEYIAIAGPSGCGKSTLVRLLLGFEKPEQGEIFYDGNSIDKIDLPSLRRKIGAVMQNGGLLNDTIYANIAISAPGLTMEEAWRAAEIAGIADDIREMPMGMFTVISEGQGGISGGQKQRLMIARAIAPKPSVLIFDEATSALDNIAQKRVTEALDGLKCTRIVIAHRLSTIRSADRILYLGNGKVLEEGTYGELMEKNGLFADMVARQQL